MKKEYLYPTTGKYIIGEYWPVRNLLKTNGSSFRITLKRIAYTKKRNKYELISKDSS